MSKPTEYKNFEWDISFKCSLEEFIAALEDNDWTVMDKLEIEDRTVVFCMKGSQVFSDNPFLEN